MSLSSTGGISLTLIFILDIIIAFIIVARVIGLKGYDKDNEKCSADSSSFCRYFIEDRWPLILLLITMFVIIWIICIPALSLEHYSGTPPIKKNKNQN